MALLVTETFDGGVKLSKEDLQLANKLWAETINSASIEFQKQTGKPAEVMREAITAASTRRVNQHSSWNTWQKIWWQRLPKVHNKEYWGKCVTSYNCPLD